MQGVTAQGVLAAVLLLALTVPFRVWWTAENREVGLRSERVWKEGGGRKGHETYSHASRVSGWWPKAGEVTFFAGLVAIAALTLGLILRRAGILVPVLGYMGTIACLVVLIGGLAFIWGKPPILDGTRFSIGVIGLFIGPPIGIIGGILLVKGV